MEDVYYYIHSSAVTKKFKVQDYESFTVIAWTVWENWKPMKFKILKVGLFNSCSVSNYFTWQEFNNVRGPKINIGRAVVCFTVKIKLEPSSPKFHNQHDN